MQIDFTAIDEKTNTLISNSKRTFILLMKNVGDILDLDTSMMYDPTSDADGTYI